MTEEQLQALEPALADYLDRFPFCRGFTQTFGHLGAYVHGLPSDLPARPSNPSPSAPARRRVPSRNSRATTSGPSSGSATASGATSPTCRPNCPRPTTWARSASSTRPAPPRRGTRRRAWPARTWLPRQGRSRPRHRPPRRLPGAFKTPLDAASYLPKEWDADRKRCRAAGIPDAVVYRPKWRIAPEQLDRARNGGVAPDGLTFDEGYGACPGFVAGPDERRRRFVGEVPRSFPARRSTGRDDGRPRRSKAGRPRTWCAVAWRSGRSRGGCRGWAGRRLRTGWGGSRRRGCGRTAGRPVGGLLRADPGRQRRDGGGEVLPVQRRGGRPRGGAGWGRLPAPERGALLPDGEVGAGLHALRGAAL